MIIDLHLIDFRNERAGTAGYVLDVILSFFPHLESILNMHGVHRSKNESPITTDKMECRLTRNRRNPGGYVYPVWR